MTIDKVIEMQDATSDMVYLHLIGGFYHAYNFGAEAVAETMGYNTRAQSTKAHPQYTECGFPINALGGVCRKFAMFRLEDLVAIERDEIRRI